MDNEAKKEIMVVDDSAADIMVIQGMLEDDFEIVSVKSGEAALKILCRGTMPDLILLDILMPEMSGWETFNKIRGISKLADVPIAFMTSLDDVESEKKGRQMGASDFIRKPVKDRGALLEKIGKIVNLTM